jgi:DNA-binding MarR family transcriptional regulator
VTDTGARILREGRARRTAQLDAILQQLTPADREAVEQATAALERLLGGPHE